MNGSVVFVDQNLKIIVRPTSGNFLEKTSIYAGGLGLLYSEVEPAMDTGMTGLRV